LEEAERRAAARCATEEARRVLRLRLIERRPPQEVAELLGIPVGRVYHLTHDVAPLFREEWRRLNELLTGRPPFRAATTMDTLLQVMTAEPVPVRRLQPGVPRDLETVCLKCPEKEPGRRYPSAAALANDLGRFLDGQPVRARPVGPAGRLLKGVRRRPVVAALVAILLLGLVGFVTTVGVFGWREFGLRRAAERERDRARDLEHAERVERARALARRGLWAEARQAYDEAVADGRPDADALAVERLRCLFTYEQRPNLPAELDRLDGVGGLPPAATALVLLHRADYLLSDWTRQKEALELAARALAVPDGLAGADRAYAEGLAAPTAADAVDRFQAALSLDPVHHRANSALLTACLFLGRLEEARARGDFVRQVFPDDPLPAFADAWASLLAGDRAACFGHLDTLAGRVDAERLKELRAFFTLVADLLDLADQIDLQDQAGLAGPLFRAAGKTTALPGVTRRALEPFGFGVPTVARLGRSLEALNRAVLDFYWDRNDAALQKLEAANRTHPDAMLVFVQACAQLKRATVREKTDHPAAVRIAAEARDLFYRAADAPTILPRASYRYQARLSGLMLDNALAAEPLAADPQGPARTRAQSDRLAEEGRRRPEVRRKFLPQALGNLADPECARFLVGDWLREEPDSPDVLRLRARLDLRTGDWTAALRHADRVLRARPDDREMHDVRRDALAGMRKSLE
jgi:tetratricopeptide (TPR) repeat protein